MGVVEAGLSGPLEAEVPHGGAVSIVNYFGHTPGHDALRSAVMGPQLRATLFPPPLGRTAIRAYSDYVTASKEVTGAEVIAGDAAA
ncbi:MAG: hypothetical protein V4702_03225 [Patescibacteria group bacterium]